MVWKHPTKKDATFRQRSDMGVTSYLIVGHRLKPIYYAVLPLLPYSPRYLYAFIFDAHCPHLALQGPLGKKRYSQGDESLEKPMGP